MRIPFILQQLNKNQASQQTLGSHEQFSSMHEQPDPLEGLYLLWRELEWFEAGIANLKTVDCFLGDTSTL